MVGLPATLIVFAGRSVSVGRANGTNRFEKKEQKKHTHTHTQRERESQSASSRFLLFSKNKSMSRSRGHLICVSFAYRR